MEPLIVIFIVILVLPSIFILIEFFNFIGFKKHFLHPIFFSILAFIAMLINPIVFLANSDFDQINNCCTESAVFSPEHRLTVYVWIFIAISAYIISLLRKELFPPIPEVLLNVVLLFGFIFNVFVAIQIDEFVFLFGNLPIALLFIIALTENQVKVLELAKNGEYETAEGLSGLAWQLLNASFFIKYPVFIVLILPLVLIVTSILLLFGQKTDSIVQAFTQTYKHGFSQIDHLCDNVVCGGHYLCSVAANGHQSVVQPTRYGIRNGKLIICNRQLLASNAFEELLAEKMPKTHHFIRKNYNKVGKLIHKYYYIFENKHLSDFIYVLMKPLEWMFILTLYTFDKKPENRIKTQYLKTDERAIIKNTISD